MKDNQAAARLESDRAQPVLAPEHALSPAERKRLLDASSHGSYAGNVVTFGNHSANTSHDDYYCEWS